MHTTKRLTIAYAAMAGALLVLLALNLLWGSVALSPAAVAEVLLGRAADPLTRTILLQFRLPRAVMAVLLGAALSVAGYLLQTFFANPIAGPFVMGISGGAKLAVALTMVVFLNSGLLTNSLTLILAAFAGAMAAMLFVLAVARRVRRMSILVICGVMIGYICSAVTDIVVAFAQDSNIVNLHNWSMGSFSGMTWGNVTAAAVLVVPCLAAAFLLSKPITSASLCGRFRRCWYCCPACWRPVSRRLRGRSPLWALRCRILSSRHWAAPSPCTFCRGVPWAGRRSAFCAICWPAACLRRPNCPSARSQRFLVRL